MMQHSKEWLPDGDRSPSDVPIAHLRQLVEVQLLARSLEILARHTRVIVQEQPVSLQDRLDGGEAADVSAFVTSLKQSKW